MNLWCRIGAVFLLLALVTGFLVLWQKDGRVESEAAESKPTGDKTHVASEDVRTADQDNSGIGDQGGNEGPLGDTNVDSPSVDARRFELLVDGEQKFSDPILDLGIALQPRKPHPPKKLFLPPGTKHRVVVKFVDDALARLTDENQVTIARGESGAVDQFSELATQNALLFERTFESPDQIEELRKKAALRSEKMQADLNGTMHVYIPAGDKVLQLANQLQASALIESVDIESLDSPPPPPADIAPVTPDLVSQQGYRGNDPGFGVDHLWSLGVKGEGVRFSDCEYAYNPNHEDLVDSGITDFSRAAINPTVYTNGWDDHGTAALGVTGATHNGYGVSGIAPNADLQFSSEWTVLGYNRSQAISDAVANSRAGDVVLLEMQATGAQGGFGPAEYSSSVWNITRTATDAGIIVVAAAGNGAEDLDSTEYAAYRARGDSGAIIVGAGSRNTGHTKLSYSTYGSRVDVQAWGTGVLTTGYGSFAQYGGDENQSYSNFSGTSSASACVGGVVTLLQSYAKNILDTTFTPEEMRAHLSSNGNAQTGSGGDIGPCVALNLAATALPDRPAQVGIEWRAPFSATLKYYALPFRNYKIEFSDNQTSWFDFMTGLSGGGIPGEIDLTPETVESAKRFYRFQEQ